MSKHFSWQGHLAMFSANCMWGLMSPIAKTIMLTGAMTPLVLTDLRIGGAMVLFWTASLFLPEEHVGTRDMLRLVVASLLAIVFNQGCFIFGVGLTSPGDASIITTSMPLWAMILAAFFLKEPITGRKVMGIAAGAVGALMLILGSSSAQTATAATTDTPMHIWGDMLVLLAQLSYASYLVFFKNFVSRYSLITIMKWLFTYAFIFTMPFSAHDLLSVEWSALEATHIAGVAFIVVGATSLSYIFIVIGQKRLRPTVAGMYNYVQPIVACIVAVCWGLDSFNLTKGLAVILIFGGVWLVTGSKSRKDIEQSGEPLE